MSENQSLENAKHLRKLVGLPEDFEPDPHAIEELAGCLSDLFPEGEKVDVVELLRQCRIRNYEKEYGEYKLETKKPSDCKDEWSCNECPRYACSYGAEGHRVEANSKQK